MGEGAENAIYEVGVRRRHYRDLRGGALISSSFT